jgi:archaellum biogenesis protein FlaJ (TadC family)
MISSQQANGYTFVQIRDFLQSFHEATLFLQGDRTTLERVLESVDVLKDMIKTALVCCTILLTFLQLILSY